MVRDPTRFAVVARQWVIAAVIDEVMRGTPFLVLTGPPGVGKTTVVAAIRDDLIRRSVRVMQVRRRQAASISLHDMATQIVGESGAGPSEDDVARLLDIVTGRDAAGQQCALIIDDAECLETDAFAYLRLLAILARQAMPRILFVGRPEFWQTDYASRSDLKQTVAARWELPPMTSEEALDFIEQSIAISCPGTDCRTASDGIAALVGHGDGSCRRIVSLLSLAWAQRDQRDHRWLTARSIERAVLQLDDGAAGPSGETAQPPRPVRGHRRWRKSAPLQNAAVADVSTAMAATEEPAAPPPPSRRGGRLAAGALALLAVMAVGGWQALVHFRRTEAQAGSVGRMVVAEAPDANAVAGASTDASSESAANASPVQVVVAKPAPMAAVIPAASLRVELPMRENVPPVEPLAANIPAAKAAAAAARDRATVMPAPAVPTGTAHTPVPEKQAAAPATAEVDATESSHVAMPPAPPQPVAPASTEADSDHAAPAAPEAAKTDDPAPEARVLAPPPPPAVVQRAEPPKVPSVAPADAPGQRAADVPPSASTSVARAEPAIVAPAGEPVAAPGAKTVSSPAPGPIAARTEPAIAAPAAVAPVTSPELTMLLSRGDAMLELGDVLAARLLYQRAAALGSAQGATSVGKTYDPLVLAVIGASGVAGDRAAAAAWYRKGAARGDPDGARRLAGLAPAK